MNDEVTILVAEDDDGHAELILEHLREGGVINPILRFTNGAFLLEYLSRPFGSPSAAPNGGGPFLILLDIRMPVMDGVETLRALKSRDELKVIPVIMLTTSDEPREIEECYRIGCNFYVTKPLEYDKFRETLRCIGSFILIIKVAEPGKP